MSNQNVNLPIPKAVADLPTSPNADTNNWDTVFAIHFSDANTAITDNWSNVDDGAKQVKVSASDDPSFNIDATLGPWQLVEGGDGKNIRMECPFVGGTYNASGKPYPLKGCSVIIEVGMQWVPNPDQFAFSIAGNDEVAAITNDLNNSVLDKQLSTEFQNKGKTLSSSAKVTVINKDQDWLITDGSANYYVFYTSDKDNDKFLQIYQFQDSWKNNLQLLKQAVSQSEPAVNIVAISHNPTQGIAADVFPELLSQWFNTNIGEFNHVFCVLDLSPSLAQDKNYDWIKPTSTSYAVTDKGTLETSVFGVLTMTQGHTPPSSHQVSPNAIPSTANANAGFLISGVCFMKNMMLAGAQSIFNGAPSTSFDISNDGLTITNNAKLTWGRFKKDDKSIASVSSSYAGQLDQNQLPPQMITDLLYPHSPSIDVRGYSAHVSVQGSSWYLSSPDDRTQYLLELNSGGDKINIFDSMVLTIDKSQFSMSLVNNYLEIQFIDLIYHESWEYDVHINYTEKLTLSLTDVGSGKKVFAFNQNVRNLTVNVTKTRTAITVGIVEDVLVVVLTLLTIAVPLFVGWRAAAAIEATGDSGSAVLSGEGFANAEKDINTGVKETDELKAVANAAKELSEKRWGAFKTAISATKWKVFAAIVATVASVVTTQKLIAEILEAIAKDDWEKVPSFDEFANQAIQPYNWPGVANYNLVDASLASSLQIALETK